MHLVLLRLLVAKLENTERPYQVYERLILMPPPFPGLMINLTNNESVLSLEVMRFDADHLMWDVPTGRFIFVRTYPFRESRPSDETLVALGFERLGDATAIGH